MLYITSKCNIIDLSLILGPTSTSVEPIELILFNKSLFYKLNGPVIAFCYGYTVFYFHFNVYQTVGGLCQLVLLFWFPLGLSEFISKQLVSMLKKYRHPYSPVYKHENSTKRQ